MNKSYLLEHVVFKRLVLIIFVCIVEIGTPLLKAFRVARVRLHIFLISLFFKILALKMKPSHEVVKRVSNEMNDLFFTLSTG